MSLRGGIWSVCASLLFEISRFEATCPLSLNFIDYPRSLPALAPGPLAWKLLAGGRLFYGLILLARRARARAHVRPGVDSRHYKVVKYSGTVRRTLPVYL